MNTQVVAYTPKELATAQLTVRDWCAENIRRLLVQLKDARDNLAQAERSKFRTQPFRQQIRKCERRIDFYKKIGKAIKLGYMIVPNFDLQLFAVRSKKARPKHVVRGEYAKHVQAGEALPEGEGRYVSALPIVDTDYRIKKRSSGEEYKDWFSYPVEMDEEITFPTSIIKPHVIAETQRALTHRLFDQVGLAKGGFTTYENPRVRYRDPIVCGRIRDTTRGEHAVTFFIAWWLDHKDI